MAPEKIKPSLSLSSYEALRSVSSCLHILIKFSSITTVIVGYDCVKIACHKSALEFYKNYNFLGSAARNVDSAIHRIVTFQMPQKGVKQ